MYNIDYIIVVIVQHKVPNTIQYIDIIRGNLTILQLIHKWFRFKRSTMMVLSIFLNWPRGGSWDEDFINLNHRDSKLKANKKSLMIFRGTFCTERQFAIRLYSSIHAHSFNEY